MLPKRHICGTHRCVPPEETWDRVRPHLFGLGITRCADVTDLDRIGIPVFCAIRPRGHRLQVANGKGPRSIDARVSAVMEAIEFWHWERIAGDPSVRRRGSYRQLRDGGEDVVAPRSLPQLRVDQHFDDDFVLDWVAGEELHSGRSCWVPAAAVYVDVPTLYKLSTNGLASGNHIVEATLHALYEVVERDAFSRLVHDGRLRFPQSRCRVIDPATIGDRVVGELCDKLRRASIELTLIHAKSPSSVPAFMAVIVDTSPFANCSMVNLGYGAHLSAAVAASRAITEAAQSRLSFIHAAREDAPLARYRQTTCQRSMSRFFGAMRPDSAWSSVASGLGDDLEIDLRDVLSSLRVGGFDRVYRVELTRPPWDIPVVKVLVPGTQKEARLF